MAGISINIKQTITMTAKVSKGPVSLSLISAIIYLIRITRQIDLRLVLALAIGVGQQMCRMRYRVILACTL